MTNEKMTRAPMVPVLATKGRRKRVSLFNPN
jgi:hypothetical protein